MKIMKLMKKNGPMAALFPDLMPFMFFMVKRLGLMADSSESGVLSKRILRSA